MHPAAEGLPESWVAASLGELCNINGRAFLPLPGASTQPVVFVPMASVNEEFGGMDISLTRPLAEVTKGYTSFIEDDVLFAKITPCMENGKLAVVPPLPTQIAFGSTEFHVLRSMGAVEPRWVAYYLSQLEFRRTARQGMSGSAGQLRVQAGWLAAFHIPVAPIDEQRRVIERLDGLLTELEAGVKELTAAQKKLTQYRQSLLKAAVEGTLTADWRAQNPPQETGAELLARILRERRARWEARQLEKFKAQGKEPPRVGAVSYPEPASADTVEGPQIPATWTWATIEQISSVGTGVTPLRSKHQYFDGGHVPWVTSGALNAEKVTAATEYVTDAALKECRLLVYPAGALLVAMYGEGKTRGKCAELGIDATINQAIAALVFEGISIKCRAFVKAFLWNSYERMRQQASGGVQPNLNLQIIKSLVVPMPPLDEQAQIVAMLDMQLESLEAQANAIARGLRMATAQRQNILRAAFSGELVPQDPNDEPASVLLARIREQRAATQTGPQRRKPRVAREPE